MQKSSEIGIVLNAIKVQSSGIVLNALKLRVLELFLMQ